MREDLPKEKSKTKDKKSDAAVAYKRQSKAVTILLDVLVILAVLVVGAFAILKFAPDSGLGQMIGSGVDKVVALLGINAQEEAPAPNDTPEDAPTDTVVDPISDKATLVGSQLYHNKFIGTVGYDPSAYYVAGNDYGVAGASESVPIENDYWADDEMGRVLYDEQAVASVIRFCSAFVDYINNGSISIFDEVEDGSPASEKLVDEDARLERIEFQLLGIGDIRQDGNYFYVWTKETIVETVDGTSTEQVYYKVYLLDTTDDKTMKVVDYAVVSDESVG
jgi:hypothetical protein